MKLIFEGDIESIKAEMKEFLGDMATIESKVDIKEVAKKMSLPKDDYGTEIKPKQELPQQPAEPTPTRDEVPSTVDSNVLGSGVHSSDVDSDGLPWDARIHSSNKEKVKDGTWRKRRGMNDKAFIASVEAELRAKTPNAAASSVVSQPINKTVPPFGSMTPEQYQQTVQAPQIPPMPTTAHRVEMPQAPAMPQNVVQFQQPAPVQTLPPNTYDAQTFRKELVMILTRLMNEGKIPQTWVNENKHVFGGAEVWEWENNEAACLQLFELFAQWGFINKAG